MSYDDERTGWYEVLDPREVRERDAEREREVRERFKIRAEKEKTLKQLLEGDIHEAMRMKEMSESRVVKKKEDIARAGRDIVTLRELRREHEIAAEESRQLLMQEDEMMRRAVPHRSLPDHSRRIMTVSEVMELLGKAREHVTEAEDFIRHVDLAIQECEQCRREAAIAATDAAKLKREQQEMVDTAHKRIQAAENFIRDFETIATVTWPMERRQREITYMKDLSLYLRENLPMDIFKISDNLRPNHKYFSKSAYQFIIVELRNESKLASVYINCAPENVYARFELHEASRDSMNDPEEIEMSFACMTENEVIKMLRDWKEKVDMYH